MKATNIPIVIVLMLVVFIVVLFALNHILGSPECDDLANTTAFHLMNAINDVSREDFPFWNYEDGVPSNDNVAYYRKSFIRLCQQNYGNYETMLRYFGGEPEYKIYYEKFPDPGRTVFGWQGLWTENYPWSGGAGSTLIFWGGLKAVSTGVELVSWGPKIWKGIKRINTYRRIAGKIDEINFNLFDSIFRPNKLLDDVDFKNFLNGFKTVDGREAIKVANQLTEKQFDEIVEGLSDIGILKKSGNKFMITSNGQIVVDNTRRPLTNRMIIRGEKEDVAYGFLKCNDCPGGILPPESISEGGRPGVVAFRYDYETNTIGEALTEGVNKNDYLFETSSTAEVLQDQIDELKTSPNPVDQRRARSLESTLAFDETGAIQATLDDLKKTNYYNDFLKRRTINEELAKYADGILIDDVLTKFNVERTVLFSDDILDPAGNGLLTGLRNSWDEVGVKVNGVLTDSTGIPDKLKAMGVTDPLDALDNLYNPLTTEAGIMMFPTHLRVNSYEDIANGILDGIPRATTGPNTGPNLGIVDHLRSLPNFDVAISDSEILKIYDDISNLYGPAGTRQKMPQVWFERYIKDWANAKGLEPWADVDDGVVISLFKQDSRPWYNKWDETLKKYVKRTRPVWYKARNLITPTNSIALGLFLSDYEGCLGNSLCVFSHGSLDEYPFYLKESAKDYFIRVWRPVTAWSQFAGYSALLMAVPEHPRFYAVGPCFAEAKVWKTRYEGEWTIFVDIERFDLNDTASNYCYADTDLVNAYAGAWLASDATDIAQLIVGGVHNKASGVFKKAINSKIWKIFDWVDPSSLFQAVLESMISWPLEPWKPLTWNELVQGATQVPLEGAANVKEELEGG
ncbi:MAG: hypothetical protein ABIE55_04465 [Candidatus Aenigmatarchaeota archaeon]